MSKAIEIYKGLGGVLGIGAIGVGSFFLWKAIWPYLNSEDGNEPSDALLLPSDFEGESMPIPTPPNAIANSMGLKTWRTTGYSRGSPKIIDLVEVAPGKWLMPTAADFYLAMAADAKAEGVIFKINTAFRTMREQQRLYALYLSTKHLPDGTPDKYAKAALPGWSNHQLGLALDIETDSGRNASFKWLTANAHRYSFKRTVASEPWHWEFVA